MIGNVRELEDEPDLPAGNYADRHERAEGAASLISGLALIGSFAAIWDDVLPPLPEEIWRENLAIVARELAG